MKVRLSAVRSITAVLFALAGGPTWSDEATPAMGAVPETRAVPDWYAPAPPNPAWSAGSWEPLPPMAPGQAQPGVTAPQPAAAAVTAEWYQFQAEFEANRAELYSVYQELQNTQALLEHAQAALERAYSDYQQGLAEQRLLREQLAGAAVERDRAQTLAMQMKAELEAAKATLAQNLEQMASSQTLALSRTEEGAQLRSELADRERHLAELRNELQDATAALSQAQTEAAAFREELLSAQSRAAASREELLRAQSQAAAFREELLRVRTEATASREDLVSAQSQYQACHAQLVELDAELEGANSETASARQSLAQAFAARDALDRALSAREAELAEAEAAVTVAREESEQLRQAAGGLAGGLAAQTAQESVAMMTTGTMPASLDVDQDGVSDSLDLCPETEKGVAVGPTGCVLNATMTLEGVGFRYDSHELTDESHAILDRVAGILEQYPDLKLEVAGHADAQGDPAYNLWLSQQRAETVRKYLITQGVNRDNLTAHGYGAEQPVADNSTWEGLVRNRRVELRRHP
jgi:outer membrane protein OmpA-like peptidoglycan-associated protein